MYQNHVIWSDYLSVDDWDTIRRLAPLAGAAAEDVRSDVGVMTRVLAHPATFESVFAGPDDPAALTVSPFLAFALIVHRGWDELQHVAHVDEWVGPRRRLPVLGGDDLRQFLGSSSNRLFMTELLASYTRVASGAVWVHTRRGWRRRRFSELDPVRLASLLEVVPEDERPGIYRRLGDLALFLTGVFPDHTEMRGLAPYDEGRLLRLSGLGGERPGGLDRGFYRDRRSARTARSAVVPLGHADSPSADCIDAGGCRGRRALRARPAHPQLSHRSPSVHSPRRMVRRTPYLTRPARPPPAVTKPR